MATHNDQAPEPTSLPPNLTPGELATWTHQETFLSAFIQSRSFLKAAKTANISYRTAYFWKDRDYLGFNNRLNAAYTTIGDWAEETAFQRITSPDKNRGSDLLLLAILNAYKPERYKPAIVLNDPALKETLERLRNLSRKLRDHETKANQEQGYQEAPDAIEQAQDILASRLPPKPMKAEDEGG